MLTTNYLAVTDANENTILALDANNAHDIYFISVGNRSATDVDVILRDTTGGATKYRWAVKAGATFGFVRELAAARRQSAKNSNWTIQVSAAVTAIDVSVEAIKRAA